MNRYETVCILKPDAGDEVVKAFIQKTTASLESGGGKLEKLDEWGRRRLAYPIQKKNEGYYFVMEYNSSPEASKEIGRLMRLNETVLRHQTIRLDEQPAAAQTEEAKTAPAEGGIS
ncbi:MAG: 30S ribosomal protein S6 [Deltaproteobacteria bacterium]|nr:30S ribosomal protein S6 [Deltaproteobacteria bacterium]